MTSSATPTVIPAEGYAGDVTPQQAWQWVQEGKAVLVDVRSSAEMEWVGRVPGAAAVPWKQWPGMAMNPDFDAQLRAAVPAGQSAVLLCRSGVRSIAAARRATELGIKVGVHRHAWPLLPGHGSSAGHVADPLAFGIAAHIHQHGLPGLHPLPGLLGRHVTGIAVGGRNGGERICHGFDPFWA